MSTKRRFRVFGLLGLLCACGGSQAPAGAVAADSAAADVALPDGGGDGSIAGSADGTPFTSVVTAYWIGAPDSAATTVVYVFSGAIPCSDLQAPGWDTRISDRSQVLEMKMFGTSAPATFTVTTSATPAPGEAAVNYTLSSTAGTPMETAASGGMVQLTGLTSGASATGIFRLTFPGGSLTGNFNAVFCPGGHEP